MTLLAKLNSPKVGFIFSAQQVEPSFYFYFFLKKDYLRNRLSLRKAFLRSVWHGSRSCSGLAQQVKNRVDMITKVKEVPLLRGIKVASNV